MYYLFQLHLIKWHVLKIGLSGKVISDILEIANTLSLEGFLVTIDVEKAFDSVNHCLLLQIL